MLRIELKRKYDLKYLEASAVALHAFTDATLLSPYGEK